MTTTIARVESTKIRGLLSRQQNYHTIRQGKATNTLAAMKTVIEDSSQLNLYGDAVISKEDYKLFIDRYSELTNGIRPTAKMLLDALVITATESGQTDTMVKLPLKEYMKMRGLRDEKSARAQVKEDIRALDRIRIEYKEKRRGQESDFLNISLSGGTNGIMRGVILYRFNQDFYNVLMNYPIMPYPKEILALNPRHNPNSPHFLRRISEHKNMNYGKTNEDIIGIKTLIEASPAILSYSELGEKAQVQQRIIAPFERDMDAIQCLKWNYCGKNGIEIEPPETYAEFEQARIKITWINYPARQR